MEKSSQFYRKGEKVWWDKFDKNGQKIGSYRSEIIDTWPFETPKREPGRYKLKGKEWIKVD